MIVDMEEFVYARVAFIFFLVLLEVNLVKFVSNFFRFFFVDN